MRCKIFIFGKGVTMSVTYGTREIVHNPFLLRIAPVSTKELTLLGAGIKQMLCLP